MNDGLRSTLVALSLIPLVACHESSDDSQFLAPGVNALGFATESVELSGGVLAAREFEAGDDQNGDGDGEDTLLRIVDLTSGFKHIASNVGAHASGGSLVAFTIPEAKEGVDLNGDGDELDQVLHVFDARRRTVTNVGFATDGMAPLVTDGFVVAVVAEADQGAELDGEPGLFGVQPLVYQAEVGRSHLLDILVAYQGEALRTASSRLAGFAREDQIVDLNADGDRNDELVFWHDLTADTTILGYAAELLFGFDADFLVYRASEFEQSTDIDGDGLEGENLCIVVELDTGIEHIFDDSTRAAVGGGLAFVQLDLHAGMAVLDATTGNRDEIPDHALRGMPRFADRRMAFLVDETIEGDGNGDGDQTDALLFLYDARAGLAENTQIAVESDGFHGFDIDAQRVVYLHSEACDSFEQCPGFDGVLRERLHSTGISADLGLGADGLRLEDGRVALILRQSIETSGADRHRLAVLDLADGRLLTTELIVDPSLFDQLDAQSVFSIEGNRVVVGVREEELGEDANGDGDDFDTVAFAVRLQ